MENTTTTTGITVQPYEYEMVLLQKAKDEFHSILYGKNNLRSKELMEEEYRKDIADIQQVSQKFPDLFKKGKAVKQQAELQDKLHQVRNMKDTISRVLETHIKQYHHAKANYFLGGDIDNRRTFSPSQTRFIRSLNETIVSFLARGGVKIDIAMLDPHGSLPDIE